MKSGNWLIVEDSFEYEQKFLRRKKLQLGYGLLIRGFGPPQKKAGRVLQDAPRCIAVAEETAVGIGEKGEKRWNLRVLRAGTQPLQHFRSPLLLHHLRHRPANLCIGIPCSRSFPFDPPDSTCFWYQALVCPPSMGLIKDTIKSSLISTAARMKSRHSA